MSNSVTGVNSASGSGASGSTNADSQISRMRQGFEQAIAQASEITQMRQEAGTALAAANSRLNT